MAILKLRKKEDPEISSLSADSTTLEETYAERKIRVFNLRKEFLERLFREEPQKYANCYLHRFREDELVVYVYIGNMKTATLFNDEIFFHKTGEIIVELKSLLERIN